jgi:two-component system response regulator HydG
MALYPDTMGDSRRSPPRPESRPTSAPPLLRPPTPEASWRVNGTIPPPSRNGATHPLRSLVDIAQSRITLVVENEAGAVGHTERTLVHEGDVCRIGTHASNDLVLTDPAVSRFHCRLVLEENGWHVRDAGSMNGTWLNGVRIRDADLSSDAMLTLGSSVIRVRPGGSGPKTLVPSMPSFGALIGMSRAMQKLFSVLEKVAASEINVFIEGESGTGKELVATEIVQRGARAERPFVVVDCGAISPTLVESELFGHVRGAFTGADRDRVGAFEAAEGGTVFLDEIGELPLAVQPKLLRALEAREIRRVGETRSRKVNVRVLSATNRDLEREVNKGLFREDLYFRLAVVHVRVPPLRERLEDLPALVRLFLANIGAPQEERLFPEAVISELTKHHWPGNVRELRNYVERAVVLQNVTLKLRERAKLSVLPPEGQVDIGVPFKIAKDALIDSFERNYVRALLQANGNNMTRAARAAGIDRMYLHRLVQKHGIKGSGNSNPAPRT